MQHCNISLIVFIGKRRKRFKSSRYDIIVKLYEKIKQEIPDAQLYLMDHRYPHEPEEIRPPKKNIFWCPYCAAYRKFKPWHKYKRCEICLISDSDFYVKKYNGLFLKGKGRL